jgi:RecJ-like exonuclease
MSSPIETITLVCPTCQKQFETWYRASMNLKLDDFDEEYVREATVKTCPRCGAEVRLGSLIVGQDGVWMLG